MIGDLSRRGFMEVSGAAAVPLLSGIEWDEHAVGLDERVEGFGILIGPDDARPPADSEYFEQWDTYNFLYVAHNTGEFSFIQTDSAWEIIQVQAQSPWADTDTDGLLELPNHDGVELSEARIGWAGLDSFTEEEGEFDITSDGEQTITFQDTYRYASANVGANQGNGQASWYGWIRDADGNITGMNISYETGTFSSATVRWHVTGNRTQASYGSS